MVTATFIADGYLVYATVQGLLYIHMLPTYDVMCQYLIDSGIQSLCYVGEGKFLVGGSGHYLYLWSNLYLWSIKGAPESNPEGKIESHIDGTKFICYIEGSFFTSGGDNVIHKGSVSPFAVELKSQSLKSPVKALMTTKSVKGEGDPTVLLYAGLENGCIKVFDAQLRSMFMTEPLDGAILSLQLNRQKDVVLGMTVDGEIHMYETSTLSFISTQSIFHITQDHLLTVFFIEKLQLLVAVERRTIKFYKAASCSLIDEWFYMFKSDIRLAAKSDDDRFLILGDGDGKLCLFDLQKPIEQRFALGVPSHRPEYGIHFILYTTGLSEQQQVITCSAEREMKIWTREGGKFLKKFNLAAVASMQLFDP